MGDSRIAKIDCHESLCDSRNDDIFLDSSRCRAQNDEIGVDCHDLTSSSLAMTGKIADCFGDQSHRNDESNADSTRTAQISQIAQIITFAKKVLK